MKVVIAENRLEVVTGIKKGRLRQTGNRHDC